MLGLNYTNMMSDVIVEGGVTEEALGALAAKARGAHDEIAGRKHPGLGFMDLVEQDTSKIKEHASYIRENFDDFLLLGIGGSALGPKTILDALSPMHNLRMRPRVFIYENVDPATLKGILDVVNIEKTAVNAVTKSGSTAETMASFMVLYEALRSKLGDAAKDHFIATTDPARGNLRQIASRLGMRTLEVPPDVGGRYSVLSPVGLLTAEVAGVDADELIRGARDMHAACLAPGVMENPAYLFSSLLYLTHRDAGRGITVLMPYADRLRSFSEWFCQLWAESLGKDGKGLTPYHSVGATDQHSQLQLWMEGPRDKAVVFIKPEDYGAEVPIPGVFGHMDGIGYLGGKSLGRLISAEQEATELGLANAGRPNMTVTVPVIDAYHLGQLFYFFELSTVFIGLLMGINPFDQPSVEESKNFTYGIMGKKGFEGKKDEVEQARKLSGKWKI